MGDKNMRNFKPGLLILIPVVAGLFAGAYALSASRVDIRGTISHLSPASGEHKGEVLGRILIEGAKEPDTQVDRASVTVRAETKLFARKGKKRQPVEFSALQEGQKVEARFSGPVATSYPVQATAAEITILEE